MLSDMIHGADELIRFNSTLKVRAFVVSYATMLAIADELIDGFSIDQLLPYIDTNLPVLKIIGIPVYISSMPVNLGIPYFIAAS